MEEFENLETVIQSGWVNKIIAAAIIIVLTLIVMHMLTKFLRHLLQLEGNSLPSSTIFVNIGRVIVLTLGTSIMLNTCFNVDVNALITALGVGGIALSLGLQDTISNLIGGLQVSLMKIIQPGDNIEVGTESGQVQDVTLRHTIIENAVGETIVIPNSIISKTALVKLPAFNQVVVRFVVDSAGDGLDDVDARMQDMCRTALAARGIELETEPKVTFLEITEFGFRGKIVFFVADVDRTGEASDTVIRAIAPLTRPHAQGDDA